MLKKILSYCALPLFLLALVGDSAGNSPPLNGIPPNVPAFVPGPDVIVGGITTLIEAGSSGTQVGLAMGTDTCNNGDVELNFFAMSNTDHPVMPQSLYRMSGGAANDERFEQIGQSWLKHAFFALQQNNCGFGCTAASGGNHLGVGCSNPDSASLNANQFSLGSRAWVNPFTGAFLSTANSHTGHTHSATAHRLLVEGSDLEPMLNPSATYYAEAQLVTPHEYAWCQDNLGECNMSNNVSYRQFNVVGTMPFSFSPAADTVRMTPAINAWTGATINPIEPEPGIDGRAFIAYKVTGPVAGVWHYEYALYNENLDRGIQSFSVPLGCGIAVSNIGFHAPLNHPGFANDGTVGNAGYSNAVWTSNQTASDLSWASETLAQDQNANALRWGTLYNFRFASNRPPQAANATIGFFKTGTPVTVGIQGPAPDTCTGATPTPSPTPTPTPPPPTPTPTPGQCGYLFLDEDFDGVTAPDLPAGWGSSFTPGPADCTPSGTCALGTDWTTSTTNPSSPPNCAFHNAPDCVTDSALETPSFFFGAGGGPSSGAFMTFVHSYDLESGFDGAVLEISINGGAFTDIVAAGGTIGPGYNGTISAGTLNPMAGRPAWTGNSGGYVGGFVTFPFAASHQAIRLRFRVATDCRNAGTGWRIDKIRVEYLVPCPTPTVPPPSPPPTATATATASPPTPSPTPVQAINLSTRVRVQTGDDVGIGGFIVTGSAPKYLLFRGIGPSLTALGIPGALANPTLDLRDSAGVRILANNDWRDDPAQEALIEATGIPPSDNLEAAIVQTLAPGTYTVILRGMGMTTGVGLVEIYDLTQGIDSKLANLSTRAFIDTGDNIVIAGFILGGSGNDRIVARGIGPSLTALGVANALPDPVLELRDGNGVLLLANNDWQDDQAQAAELIAAGLAPTNDLESGIAATLAPGLYTALLAGANNGTGVGLVEIYDRGAPP